MLQLTDGAGVKAVFDSLEKDTFNDWVAALAPGRSLMVFGKASGNPSTIDRPVRPGSTFVETHVACTADVRRCLSTISPHRQGVFEASENGLIKVEPSWLDAFGQSLEAHRDLEERRTTGTALLVI